MSDSHETPTDPKGTDMVKHAVQTPGETPTEPNPDAFTAIGTVLGENDSEADVLRKQLEAQSEQIAALTAAVSNLNRNQMAQNGRMSEAEQLPTMAEAMALDSKTPVLTKEGWLVPATFGALPNSQR